MSDYERNRASNISKLDPAQQAEFAKQQSEATAKYGFNKKKGGKVKKYAEGGSVMSEEEKNWLGGADATDPFILARMRSALGPKKTAPVAAPVAAPVKPETSADLDPYGVTRRETSADLDPYGAASKPAAPVRRPPARRPMVKPETSADLDPYGVTRKETSADLDPYGAANKPAAAAPQGRGNNLRDILFPGGSSGLPSAYQAPARPAAPRQPQTIPSANFKMPGGFQMPSPAPAGGPAPAIPSAGVTAPMSYAERMRLAKLKASEQQ
jgi:hypothetical protein